MAVPGRLAGPAHCAIAPVVPTSTAAQESQSAAAGVNRAARFAASEHAAVAYRIRKGLQYPATAAATTRVWR